MARKRYTDEDVLNLLRQIELSLASGSSVETACRSAGISDATYYNWRKRYGGMGKSQLQGSNPARLHSRMIPPQFGIDSLDPCNVRPGPLPMLRVCRYGAGLAFRGPWPGGLAAVHPAPVAVGNDGVLAGRALAGFCQAYRARPTRPETRCLARFDQLLMVN